MADIKSKLTARSLVTAANPLPKTGNDVRFYAYDGSEPDATKDRQIYKRDLLVALLQSGSELGSSILDDLTNAEKDGIISFLLAGRLDIDDLVGYSTLRELRADASRGVAGSVLDDALSASSVTAVCTDGTTIWGLDTSDLRAFTLAGVRDSSKDIDLSTVGSGFAGGAACDGNHIWVLRVVGSIVTLVKWTTGGSRVSSEDIVATGLTGYNLGASTRGLATDGTYVWVLFRTGSSNTTITMRCYRISDGARQTNLELSRSAMSAAGASFAGSVATDDATLWVGDTVSDKLYAWGLPNLAREALKDIADLPNGVQGACSYPSVGFLLATDDAGDGILAYKSVDLVIKT